MARRVTKTKTETQLAVAFIGSLINKVDYCRFLDKELIYNDAIISVGYPVSFEHNLVLDAQAVKSCAAMFDQKATFTIDKTLHIDTEKKRASIAIGDDTAVLYVIKDQFKTDIDQSFIDNLILASKATKESDSRVLASSVLVNHYTFVGTNGFSFLEVLHGFAFDQTFPANGLRVPTSFINKLKQIKLAPRALGFSDTSITIHYENGAWIRSQLYLEDVYLKLSQVTSQIDAAVFKPFEKDLVDLFKDSETFGDRDYIELSADQLVVLNNNGSVLRIKTNNLLQTQNTKVSNENLKIFNSLLITDYDFMTNERMLFVRGRNFRGALAVMVR